MKVFLLDHVLSVSRLLTFRVVVMNGYCHHGANIFLQCVTFVCSLTFFSNVLDFHEFDKFCFIFDFA